LIAAQFTLNPFRVARWRWGQTEFGAGAGMYCFEVRAYLIKIFTDAVSTNADNL
jgi:hypothetical protein